MKSTIRLFFVCVVIASLLVGCGGKLAPVSNEDAISTAVAGTQQASALAQATVNAAVLTAIPATPTQGIPVDYSQMSEEELTVLIDEAVAEAVTATEQTSSAVYTTTTDNAVTTEEVVYVYDYYYNADYYVQYAEDLITEYYSLYSDLAYEMIGELNGIETQLNEMNGTLDSIDQSLQEINTTLEQGLTLAQETIDQLNTAAQTAQQNAQNTKDQAKEMLSTLQTDQGNRLAEMEKIQPEVIPTDKLTAMQSAFSFMDYARESLSDKKLSRDELMNLAMFGKEAQEGLKQFGGADRLGPDVSQFSNKFGEINQQFARGQMPQARENLGNFESSLGARPDFSGIQKPNRPGGRRP